MTLCWLRKPAPSWIPTTANSGAWWRTSNNSSASSTEAGADTETCSCDSILRRSRRVLAVPRRASCSSSLRLRRLYSFDHHPKPLQGNVLELPHALAGKTALASDLFERLLRSAVQAEASAQNGYLSRLQGSKH